MVDCEQAASSSLVFMCRFKMIFVHDVDDV